MRMKDMLRTALAGKYAVGYFEAWDQYSLEAVLAGAEEARSPVILGFGCKMMDQDWYDSGGQHRLAALGVAAASDAKVPACLLLNEAAIVGQVARGLAWGFEAVMLDTSDLPLERNTALTREVVAMAHAQGADVEGEVGRLRDASAGLGGPAQSEMTDPDDAARYVEETAVDALSVSIGNVHVMADGEAHVDLELLARIRAAVRVPLVIHGGTGFPASAVPRAIELGVAKFNVGTILKQHFLDGIREAAGALPPKADVQQAIGSRKPADILQRAKERVKAEVMRRMVLYGSAGKA